VQHTGDRGGDFGVDLVGGHFEEGLFGGDVFAGLFEPAGDGAFVDALAERRHVHDGAGELFGAHGGLFVPGIGSGVGQGRMSRAAETMLSVSMPW